MGQLQVIQYNFSFILNYTLDKATTCDRASKAIELYSITDGTIACIVYYEKSVAKYN